ncbi:MAG: aspartate dehydrogenase [Candidatus Hadarchaeum sp.]|uniref:aspartate dehydrogenase n=1 Tax=Candidatus Hadarchaeum sp. TaxID=2883567 RepID=UPI003D1148A5
MRVGLIGCGAIGTALAHMIDIGEAGNVELSWVYDLKQECSLRLAAGLKHRPRILHHHEEIFAEKNADIVVEAASQEAVRQYSLGILRSGKDLIILSVGALCDDEFLSRLREESERQGRKIYVPSGAVIGIDGVKSASLRKISTVRLVTRKPPVAFKDNEYLSRKGVKLSHLRTPKIIFTGTAREAVKLFPASVNVAATLSLAGVGFDRTMVTIVADPRIKRNIHEIRMEGESGELIARSINKPFLESPRTSYLAALSAARTLRNLSEAIQIGT